MLHAVLEARLVRGLTSVIDATNTEAVHRGTLLDLARRFNVSAVALVVPTPLPLCLERNARRPGNRRVPDVVVLRQHADVIAALPALSREGFNRVLFADGHNHTESAGGSTHSQLVTG